MPLEEKIKSGKFVILGEFETPKGADFSALLRNANLVKGRIDALVIPEMANAVMKASSLGGCAFLQTNGFETVFQTCCRDRNRLAIQADILAAAALGVPNILAVPGEEIQYGDHPQARDVYDVDLIQMIEMLGRLQSGKDMVGIDLLSPPRFCTGASINAGALGGALDIELENLDKMSEAGVEFVITTPIFDLHRFQQFVKRIDTNRVAVIPTVLLLKSAGMARYMDRNIKNISIPAEMVREIQKAPDRINQCIGIAAELINGLREMKMAGVMISTLGWEDKLPQILDRTRL